MHYGLTNEEIEKIVRREAIRKTAFLSLIMTIVISILIITNPALVTWQIKFAIILLFLIVIACFSILGYIFGYWYFREKFREN